MATAMPQDDDAARTGLVARARAAVTAVLHARVGRAVNRYVKARGGLLAGGVTYSAIFSISAALTIGWTAFMAVLGGNVELRESVLAAVNSALPGILSTAEEDGLLHPDDLVLETAITPASVIAAGVLLWTAVTMMSALRRSIRAMFGIVTPKENVVLTRVRDLAAFVALAVGVALTGILGVAAGAAGTWVMDLLGIEGTATAVVLRGAGILVALVLDSCIFLMLFRLLAKVRAPRRDLLVGALIGGTASSALRLLGTSVIGGVDDPLLGSVATLATLIVWVNLLARVAMLVAAWTANPPAPPMPDGPEATHYDETPNFVTLSVPRTLDWDYQATTGTVQVAPDERAKVQAEDLRRAGEAGVAVLEERREREAARAEERRLAARARELEERLHRERGRRGPAGAPAERDGRGPLAALRRWWRRRGDG